MFRNWSLFRRRKAPPRGGLRGRIDRRRANGRFEWLEARQMLASASWAGGATGYWDVAANWSDDAVPTSTTAVAIASGGATVTIPPGCTASASSLAIAAGAALSMPAGVDSTNPTTNCIVDSDFESPTLPAQLWTWGSLVSLSAQYAYTGSQSLVLNGASSTAAEEFAATPGSSYTTSVYAMVPNSLTGNATAWLNLYFFNSSNTQISSYYAAPNSVTILTASSATGGPLAGSVGNQGWSHFYTTAVAPAGPPTLKRKWKPMGRCRTPRSTSTISNLGRRPQAPKALPNLSSPVFPTAAHSPWERRTRRRSTAHLYKLPRARSTFNWAARPPREVSASSTYRGPRRWPARSGRTSSMAIRPRRPTHSLPSGSRANRGAFASETLPSGSGYKFNAAVTFTNVIR